MQMRYGPRSGLSPRVSNTKWVAGCNPSPLRGLTLTYFLRSEASNPKFIFCSQTLSRHVVSTRRFLLRHVVLLYLEKEKKECVNRDSNLANLEEDEN